MFRSRSPLADAPPGWWNHPLSLIALALIAAIPLVTPAIPPLTDLMGHMGRYRVELADPNSPLLTRFYDFKWAVMGNLGVDLLIIPMAKLFGIELGTKLIVMAIPPLTVLGMLLVAREAHGRIPPTALFALPLAYGFPFQWGFINFALSMALTLNAFALWLHLGRKGRFALRTWLFVPIAALVWLAHGFGWGVLGLLVFAAEFAGARDRGERLLPAMWQGGIACLPLTPPMLLMLLWRSGDVSGGTGDWFHWKAKWVYLYSILRNHWMRFDLICAGLLGLIALAGFTGLGFRMNRKLGLAALALIAAYVLLPRILLGSAYADMRLAPYMVAVVVLAVAPKFISLRWQHAVAAAALAIFAVRIGLSTTHFIEDDRRYQQQLAALDHVEKNSRVFVLVALPCLSRWDAPRIEHLGGMAIVRKDAFVNGQWSMPGAQLLSIRYAPARGFAEDPTQVIRPRRCRARTSPSWAGSLEGFPRHAFDYVWLVDAPQTLWPTDDPSLRKVWNGQKGALYRVVGSAMAASDTPNGGEARATQ